MKKIEMAQKNGAPGLGNRPPVLFDVLLSLIILVKKPDE
jgi:hypothetical protein